MLVETPMEPAVEIRIAQVRSTKPCQATNIQIPTSATTRLINNSATTRPVALRFQPPAMICSLSSARGSMFLFTLSPPTTFRRALTGYPGPVIVKEHLVHGGIRGPGCCYAAGQIILLILPHSL